MYWGPFDASLCIAKTMHMRKRRKIGARRPEQADLEGVTTPMRPFDAALGFVNGVRHGKSGPEDLGKRQKWAEE